MNMERFYDKENKRLVFVGQKATAGFWDELWGADFASDVKSVSDKSRVVVTTKKFLPPPAKILEGGCGRGQYVYAFARNGYDAYGIDYAEETVKRINNSFPDLKVALGDVSQLPYQDGEFDAYWSIGVIEHFYEGYDKITKEMARVIKPGGYLFISFPVMSPFRRVKAFFGFYQSFSGQKDNFYQFALPWQKVASSLQPLGFSLVSLEYTNGFKTLREETFLRGLAEKGVFKKILKPLADSLSFFFGHTVILVFKK